MSITLTATTDRRGVRVARQIEQLDDGALSIALVHAAFEAEKSDVVQVSVYISSENKTFHVSLGHRGEPAHPSERTCDDCGHPVWTYSISNDEFGDEFPACANCGSRLDL